MSALKLLNSALLTLILFASFSLPTTALAHPPPWAPAHGYRAKHHRHHAKHYQYIYYPSSQVYFSPARRGYYYPYQGGWRYGPTIPVGIQLGNGVSIQLGGPTPYVYHPTVIQQYPVVVLR